MTLYKNALTNVCHNALWMSKINLWGVVKTANKNHSSNVLLVKYIYVFSHKGIFFLRFTLNMFRGICNPFFCKIFYFNKFFITNWSHASHIYLFIYFFFGKHLQKKNKIVNSYIGNKCINIICINKSSSLKSTNEIIGISLIQKNDDIGIQN